MKKRILSALLLAAMMLTPVLTSCSETPGQGETDTSAASVETTPAAGESEVETEEPKLTDQIEAKDYNDYEFNYLAIQGGRGGSRFEDEMWVEEDSADVILSAVYNRNLLLEERLGIKISITPSTNLYGDISNSVTSGDNSYDLCGPYKADANSLALQGVLRDWNTLDIDYSQNWWSQGAVEKLNILGHQFWMSGSILITEIDDTLAMFYNKEVGKNYGLEDIYSIVLENKWTIDKFMEMTSAVSDDANGDGRMKPGDDVLGYVQDPASMTNNWFFAADLMNCQITEDGVFSFNVDAERVQGLLDKLAPYFQTDNVYSGLELYQGMPYFKEDKIYIYAIILYNMEDLRDMDSDFGVIPYPMYDEAQGRYITHVGLASPILTIPLINTEDDERLSDILTSMAMASKERMIPAYYEVALKDKIARDPDSATMLDIIVDSKTYDITYMNGLGLISTGASLITKGSTNFASSWAKMTARNEKIFQKTIDKYLEAGEKQKVLG